MRLILPILMLVALFSGCVGTGEKFTIIKPVEGPSVNGIGYKNHAVITFEIKSNYEAVRKTANITLETSDPKYYVTWSENPNGGSNHIEKSDEIGPMRPKEYTAHIYTKDTGSTPLPAGDYYLYITVKTHPNPSKDDSATITVPYYL